MKFTNKDAKIRLYDGSNLSSTTYTVDAVSTYQITQDDVVWQTNAEVHKKVHMLTGAQADSVYVITSNSTNIAVLDHDVEDEGVAINDTFQIGLPYYLELCLDNGDFSAPIAIRKHEEILVLDRGNVGTCAHYINDNDVAIMEPMNLTFSAMINDSDKFLDTLNWLEGNTVNGHTTVTTKGQSERIVVQNATLPFFDTTKKCYDIEYTMTGTTNTITYIFREVYFEMADQTFAEAEDGITLSLTGMCYGKILRGSGFTAGTDILA